MKTITAKIISSSPIPVSRAASILSKFVANETGASQAIQAYLRCTAAAFDELLRVHSKSDRKSSKKRKSDATTVDFESTRRLEVKNENESDSGSARKRKKEKKEKKKQRSDVEAARTKVACESTREVKSENESESGSAKKRKKEKKAEDEKKKDKKSKKRKSRDEDD